MQSISRVNAGGTRLLRAVAGDGDTWGTLGSRTATSAREIRAPITVRTRAEAAPNTFSRESPDNVRRESDPVTSAAGAAREGESGCRIPPDNSVQFASIARRIAPVAGAGCLL